MEVAGVTRNLRIARAVGTAAVAAALANLDARAEQGVALTAGPPDTLTRLPVDEVLTTRLRRALEDRLFVLLRIPLDNEGLVLLLESSAFSAACLLLGLGPLRWNPGTLLAAVVLALAALLVGAEGSIALVALPMDTHLDGLLNAQDVAIRRVPLAGLHIEPMNLGQLLSTLGVDLSARDLHSVRIGLGGGLRGVAVITS